MRRRLAALSLALALASGSAFGAPAAPKPAAAPAAASPAAAADSPDKGPISLDQARTAASAAGPGLWARLGELEAALPPRDALALLSEFRPALAMPEERSGCARACGDLALLLGLFPEAAASYEEASAHSAGGRDPELLLRAARARLACGESDKAADLASLLLLSSADARLSARARLVGAWALALRGSKAEASALAASIAGQAAAELPGELRREARFLVWATSAPESREGARAALAAEFPDSAEALAASGILSLAPLPHWYVGALSPSGPLAEKAGGEARPAQAGPASPAAAPATAAPAAPAAPDAAAPEAAGAAARRFQVGYYSKEENAKAMMAKLAAKGFAASIEARPQVKAKAGDDGRRWAVVIDGGRDPERAQARLKDAGFESYPLF